MSIPYRIVAFATVAIASLVTMPRVGAAQQGALPVPVVPARAGTTETVIAAVPTLPYSGADAVIVRRATQLPHDVILVRSDRATAVQLAQAAFMIETLRAVAGSGTPTADAVIRVPSPTQNHRHIRDAANWAQILERTTPSDLAGVGNVRHLRVDLPDHVVHVRR